MALKAGYVGVKRWLYEALTKESAANKKGVIDLWQNNAIQGAKNYSDTAKLSNRVSNNQGGTHSYADGVMTINMSGNSASGVYYGKARLHEDFADVTFKSIISFKYKATTACQVRFGSATSPTEVSATTDWKTFAFPVDDLSTADLNFVFYPKDTGSYTVYITDFMVSNANDTLDYAPYAMTNQQLTGSANEQKTAINAIISAATGAADFAAFKTAMAAISPVTRSAAPDTREASPEVIEDDPEPVTKTTKSSTKKTTTKEGE